MEIDVVRRNKRNKWVTIGLCIAMIFTCLGFCSSNKSLYLNAITEALGFSRSAYATATSCRFIVTALINILFGRFVMKFGIKKMIGAGFIFLLSSLFTNIVATNVYMFFLSESLAGIGFSFTGTAIISIIVNNWCKENQGTIMGIILSSNGIGGALAAQIVTPIIYQEGAAFGYRQAYQLVFLIVAVVGILVVLFLKEKPEGQEDVAPAPVKKKQRGSVWVGMDYDEAKKKPFFYGAAICIFLTGMCLHGANGVASSHFIDKGFDSALVATIASISSLALTCSKFFVGFIYDKLGLRRSISICSIAAILAFLLLGTISNNQAGHILSIVYGVLVSAALPLETIMLPLYAGDLFGQKSYAKMVGIFVAINTAGYAVGAPVVNLGYDLFGTYDGMFIATAIIMAGVLIALQFIIKSAHKCRDEIIAKTDVQ